MVNRTRNALMGFGLRIRGNLDFIIPLSFLVLIKLPYLDRDSSFFPVHDTWKNAQFFYYAYRDYFLTGELPLWAPYKIYGTTTYFDFLTCFSPVQCLAAFVGKVIGIRDALQLYIGSIVLEEVAFLVGVYLLACKLFERRLTVTFVCLAAVGTIFWPIQVYFNFRIYYLVPFMLLFALEFMETGDFRFVWAAGFALTCSLIGNCPFCLPIYLVTLTTFTISLAVARRRFPHVDLKSIWRADSLILLGIAALISIAAFYIMMHSSDHAILYAMGRNPDNSVPLPVFLNYGIGPNNLGSLISFLYPFPASMDWFLYLSPTVIVFLILGVLRQYRVPQMIALLATAVLLILFSLPKTGVAAALYHVVPFMKYFRHLEHIRALVKFLLLITAGYGLDAAIRQDQSATMLRVWLLLFGVVIFWDVIVITGLKQPPYDPFYFSPTGWLVHYFGIACAAVVAYLTRPAIIEKHRGAAWVMLGVFALNMVLYQGYLFRDAPIHISRRLAEVNMMHWGDLGTLRYKERELSSERIRKHKSVLAVRPYVFQNQRIPFEKARAIIEHETPLLMTVCGVTYPIIYTTAGLDPCLPGWIMKVDFWPLGVERLIRARLGLELDQQIPRDEPLGDYLMSDDVLMKALGCNSPKLFLAERVVFVPDLPSAAKLIAKSDNLNLAPIVVGQGEEPPCDWKGETGRVQVLRFSGNLLELDAQVASPCGAWLIYLDAFDPRWHATVNGKPSPILAANLAFKAVKLEPGRNRVSFRFIGNAWTSACFRILFVFGVVFGLALIAGTCWLCLRRRD